MGQGKARRCVYCEVKIDNNQLEQFYQLGRLWRERDKEMLQQKIDWYQNKSELLAMQVEEERDASLVLVNDNERDANKIDTEIEDLKEQKKYVQHAKKRLERSVADEVTEKNKLSDQLEELRERKADVMRKGDRLEGQLDKRVKMKQELLEKLQELEEQQFDQ